MAAVDPTELARIVSLLDFEPLARRAMDRSAYDYVAGGSWDELSLGENVAAWRRRTLRPRVLVDVARVSAETTMLGQACAMPVAIAIAPTHRSLLPPRPIPSTFHLTLHQSHPTTLFLYSIPS